jgi:hypothetical protein
MLKELEDQKAADGISSKSGISSADQMKERLLNRQSSKEMEVREISGEGFSQTEFSQNADTPDPRIGGSKIIFDSRLSDVTKNSETSDIDAFINVKA